MYEFLHLDIPLKAKFSAKCLQDFQVAISNNIGIPLINLLIIDRNVFVFCVNMTILICVNHLKQTLGLSLGNFQTSDLLNGIFELRLLNSFTEHMVFEVIN